MSFVLLAALGGCGTTTSTPDDVAHPVPPTMPAVPPPAPAEPPGPVELKAAIESISATDLEVDGHTIVIDASTVFEGFGELAPAVGDAVEVHGVRGADGTVVATKIVGSGAKGAPPPAAGNEED